MIEMLIGASKGFGAMGGLMSFLDDECFNLERKILEIPEIFWVVNYP